MNKIIEKKLLHFFTTGNIYEDFAKARSKKTAALRRVIRVCFYAHCAAAVLCIILAAVLRSGPGIIPVAVCEIILTGLAFLAVGDMTLMKTLLCCGDMIFAAAMFAAGALFSLRTPFFTVGAVSIAMAVCAFISFFAAACKIYLEEFSPLSIRREHYTLLPNLGAEPADDVPDMPEEPPIVLPPPRSEFRELADKLKEIICAPKKTEEPIKETVHEHITDNVVPRTEVT